MSLSRGLAEAQAFFQRAADTSTASLVPNPKDIQDFLVEMGQYNPEDLAVVADGLICLKDVSQFIETNPHSVLAVLLKKVLKLEG